MTTYYDELKKLELCPRHVCCKECELYLLPPHKGGEISLGWITYNPPLQNSWYLVPDESSEEINVKFCPWCGLELTTAIESGSVNVPLLTPKDLLEQSTVTEKINLHIQRLIEKGVRLRKI